MPTHGTVQQFAEHVLAELEQSNQGGERKVTKPVDAKIRKVETEKEQGTGRRDLVCRFYMKDTGCRKWEAFEEMEGMAEYEFYQGDFGGAAQKPTTLGTNLYIDLPERRVTGLVSRAGWKR